MANFDRNIQADLALMDLSKAFDCVSYERLATLYIAMVYGVWGYLHCWIRGFLMGYYKPKTVN